MLPIVWFYVALVLVSWVVLAFLERRRRARKIVQGCPALKVISRARLNSLMVMEPELKLIELDASGVLPKLPLLPGAIPASISQLEALLASFSPGDILVFSPAEGAPIDWTEVDNILYRLRLKQAFVLDTSPRGLAGVLPSVSSAVKPSPQPRA